MNSRTSNLVKNRQGIAVLFLAILLMASQARADDYEVIHCSGTAGEGSGPIYLRLTDNSVRFYGEIGYTIYNSISRLKKGDTLIWRMHEDETPVFNQHDGKKLVLKSLDLLLNVSLRDSTFTVWDLSEVVRRNPDGVPVYSVFSQGKCLLNDVDSLL